MKNNWPCFVALFIPLRMLFRRSLCALLAVSLTACWTPYKKSDEEERKPLRNVAGDTAFQAFIGRLRIAVRNKDMPMLATMMTNDFGYSWDASGPPSAQMFGYWDKENLWPVLGDLLDRQFAPLDLYMVSPPELTTDNNYAGPRCGMRVVGGSWKFAYFVPHGGN